MRLVTTLEETFLPGGVPDLQYPPDEQTLDRWRRRYFAALRRLRQAGIQTVSDEQAGAEVYASLRARWDLYITTLAPSICRDDQPSRDKYITALSEIQYLTD